MADNTLTSALSALNLDYLEQITSEAADGSLEAQLLESSYFDELSQSHKLADAGGLGGLDVIKAINVQRLINAYRLLGARVANINPLDSKQRIDAALTLDYYGFTEADLEREFPTSISTLGTAKLSQILEFLQRYYTGTVSCEFNHISDGEIRRWFRDYVEAGGLDIAFDKEAQTRILAKVTAAETLERYLHTRYVGQKRFSLEGGDSLIPLLDDLLVSAAKEHNVQEVVVGMAHRGRLNVLINILGKQPANLFSEFEGKYEIVESQSGDVKYHMGFSSQWRVDSKDMRVSLAFNPSHLEIVNPVVEGSVRARQERRYGDDAATVLPILLHGDAAFAGQGVVTETLNLSQTRGYQTGGTVHIIINNQIGFTTSAPEDARSSYFCTDVAKIIEAPIIHCNGNDPQAVVAAARLALNFRQRFHRDVVIDMVCYRKLGHNEQDEPMLTQPLMYRKISNVHSPRQAYARKLVLDGVFGENEVAAIEKDCRQRLEQGLCMVDEVIEVDKSKTFDWSNFNGQKQWDKGFSTKFNHAKLQKFAQHLATIPETFNAHAQLKRVLDHRMQMANGERPLDWGMAENLAYATLLSEGYQIRLSGQDCGRGTFSHRHAIWHDQLRQKRGGGHYVPLESLAERKADIDIIDSLLSEEAVLGFEYGFSTTLPDALVVWEAQFGDFANGAQVVIDQFIASGEAKWGRLCALVMFLPHGYEGQGPEHSSARIERYLQLCAEYNIQVCVPSTPAQIYHLLRRQMIRDQRKPLIVITPKSLLRHKQAVSDLQELSEGEFQPVIAEVEKLDDDKVRSLVFCSGKVYYDVLAQRQEDNNQQVALVRIEQLYPFAHTLVQEQINRYKNLTQVIWCQEEPGNQGAWHRIQHYLRRHIPENVKLHYALRPSSASTAAGYASTHKREQQAVVKAALCLDENELNKLKSRLGFLNRHEQASKSKSTSGSSKTATAAKTAKTASAVPTQTAKTKSNTKPAGNKKVAKGGVPTSTPAKVQPNKNKFSKQSKSANKVAGAKRKK